MPFRQWIQRFCIISCSFHLCRTKNRHDFCFAVFFEWKKCIYFSNLSKRAIFLSYNCGIDMNFQSVERSNLLNTVPTRFMQLGFLKELDILLSELFSEAKHYNTLYKRKIAVFFQFGWSKYGIFDFCEGIGKPSPIRFVFFSKSMFGFSKMFR